MEFLKFKRALQGQFAKMTGNVSQLYMVNVDKDKLWDTYLNSFPDGTNPLYRERAEHDCSACRHFIKAYGGVVSIKDGIVHSLWDVSGLSDTYQCVADVMSAYVKSHAVDNVCLFDTMKLGVDSNYGDIDGTSVKFDHFYLEAPKKFCFVGKMGRHATKDSVLGRLRDVHNVFRRSLEEFSVDSVMTVYELIQQNSLYKGEEWQQVISTYLGYLKEYKKLDSDAKRDIFAWEKMGEAGEAVCMLRNTSIGTFIINVNDGMDLEIAVRKYEEIVAPANYKRPKPVYSKRMLDDARKTITEMGYMPSLERRFATLDDITVNNILFSNRDAQVRIKKSGVDAVFDEMAGEVTVNPRKFEHVEEIGIEDFIKNVLPTVREMELFLENRHASNLVSLVAPKNAGSKTMFNWDNGFSWAYSGNITDSDIKNNVKLAGGNVNGVLRFSIQWNDGEKHDACDLDAHCVEADGFEISFQRKKSGSTGELDIDIINPEPNVPAVENIVWTDVSKMPKGKYEMFVDCYTLRRGASGFKAEVEVNGETHSYEYNTALRNKQHVAVADVEFDGTAFKVVDRLPSDVSRRELWGIHTGDFIPVSVLMYSPNYWDGQQGVGNKHYFFMLKGCVNDEMPNGFYNEFLKNDLLEHKRVFEALGSKMHVEDVDDQLSGVGFSSTRHNDVLLKVKGATERVLRVKF